MRKKRKKSINRKNFLKRRNTFIGIIPILFIVSLLALFSETVRTMPAGAFSEKLVQKYFEVPKLNSKLIEQSSLNKELLENKNKIIKKNEQDLLNIQKKISKVQKEITEIESKKLDQETEVIVAKAPNTPVEEIMSKSVDQKIIDEKMVDIPKIEETIKVVEDTENKLLKILDDISEQEGTGTSINNKNITYMQILQSPKDLDLNLKYAQQQGKMGNFKQTISTLERLNMIYPDNVEIKLYLLSILVQIDSPEKATTIIDEMKLDSGLASEDLETLLEFEEELKDREPSLWTLTADISTGAVYTDNANSVSKTRTKKSSDSVIGFNSAKYDRTLSGGIGLSASRPIGEETSFLINLSNTTSEQYQETDDDYQSYGLTLALDTVLGNQSVSPYFMLSKSDYQTDADSFSVMGGVGGFFTIGERNSISYGYSFSDSKGNHNSTDTTANETNSISHGISLGHDFIVNQIITTSLSLGYGNSNAIVGAGNDYENYDLGLSINFAFPWAYISVGNAFSFNDYKVADSSVVSNLLRSDYTNTTDIMLTKAIGDIFPALDPNRSLFINLSYEKVISEANILNYDYIADSFSLSFSRSFRLN